VIKPVEWTGNALRYLDQTLLPAQEVFRETTDFREVAEAIKSLRIRGAPLIGISAAYGLCLGALEGTTKQNDFYPFLEKVDSILRSTRPTAVNLFWALDRMKKIWQEAQKNATLPEETCSRLIEEATTIEREDEAMNRKIAELGASLIQDGDVILTHCNAGALACGSWGTALGVIYWAQLKEGKKIRVYADETRPLLQGARLTAYELTRNGIPTRVICDNMAAFMMQQGKINKIIVGADRIATNGDTANKIGTYSLAVLARYHNIPFYVAAPTSTIDFEIVEGSQIPIEERSAAEIKYWKEHQIVPEKAEVENPAFDITPNSLITAIITEQGILYPPFREKILSIRRKVER